MFGSVITLPKIHIAPYSSDKHTHNAPAVHNAPKVAIDLDEQDHWEEQERLPVNFSSSLLSQLDANWPGYGDHHQSSLHQLQASQYEKNATSKQEKAWMRYARLILPHVGLVCVCTLYCIGGAIAFYLVEGPHEIAVRDTLVQQINHTRATMLAELWEMARQDESEESDWRNLAFSRLDNLTELLFTAFEDHYVSTANIRHGNFTDRQWTFPAAVFFAITTISTIGYGHLVPITIKGRFITVIFGLFGVPLMLVTIADIGKFLSDFVILSYSRFEAFQRWLADRGKRRRSLRQDIQQELINLDMQEAGENVPITLILIIVVGYTALGGFLLRLWETQWTFFDSFYFCFITMTTVGFGDYVPENQTFYIVTIIYIVLGLAVTTMCVDLAGSVYIKKIHYFGRQLQSAKDALRTMGEVMRYATFLSKKYGLTEEQLRQISLIPDEADWEEYMFYQKAFTPRDVNEFSFIDYHLSESLYDYGRSSSGKRPKTEDAVSYMD